MSERACPACGAPEGTPHRSRDCWARVAAVPTQEAFRTLEERIGSLETRLEAMARELAGYRARFSLRK